VPISSMPRTPRPTVRPPTCGRNSGPARGRDALLLPPGEAKSLTARGRIAMPFRVPGPDPRADPPHLPARPTAGPARR
jgi:hypothetical protein